jgi:hypothetical protein
MEFWQNTIPWRHDIPQTRAIMPNWRPSVSQMSAGKILTITVCSREPSSTNAINFDEYGNSGLHCSLKETGNVSK